MTIKKLLLTLSICVVAALSLTAQLGLIISDVNAERGAVVEVDLMVSGFSDITSMQFSVNWDSTVLAFQAIEDISESLPGFTEKEIGLVEAPSGAIRVAWFDNTIQGISVPDSTKLFTLKFEIISEVSVNSSIAITGDPIVIEFTDSNGATVELSSVEEGEVVVPDNSTSVTYFPAPNGMELYQNEPNPFKSLTKIIAIFPSVASAQFFITDISGKIVYQNNFQSVQGENTIEIRSDLLNTPGTYYYTLQSEHYQLSRKMILIP